MVIGEADSLLPSRDQMESAGGQYPVMVTANALWQELGVELAALGDSYDSEAATKKTEDITDRAWELAREESSKIKAMLVPPL